MTGVVYLPNMNSCKNFFHQQDVRLYRSVLESPPFLPRPFPPKRQGTADVVPRHAPFDRFSSNRSEAPPPRAGQKAVGIFGDPKRGENGEGLENPTYLTWNFLNIRVLVQMIFFLKKL